jgi:hypothetical protein
MVRLRTRQLNSIAKSPSPFRGLIYTTSSPGIQTVPLSLDRDASGADANGARAPESEHRRLESGEHRLGLEGQIKYDDEIVAQEILMQANDERLEDENRRIRTLRISCDLLVRVLMTERLSLTEAESLIGGFRRLALRLFPGKQDAVDLIYMPRFRRALREAGVYSKGPVLRLVNGGRS